MRARMGTISMLLLFYLLLNVESNVDLCSRSKRETLSRSKRRWVLSTIEIVEEDPGPYRKLLTTMHNDKTEHGRLVYTLKGDGVTTPPCGLFEIDKYSGDVYALKSIDRESREKDYHIIFDVLDEKSMTIDDHLSFDIKVKDINDNAPKFRHEKISADVKENYNEGDALLSIDYRDPDFGVNGTVTLNILHQEPKEPKMSLKTITPEKSELRYSGCFDYEANDQGTPSLSSTAVITLNMKDANTHPPVFKKREYTGTVLEGIIKEELLRVGVDDKDEPKTPGWRAVYTIIKGNDKNQYKISTDPETNEGILGLSKGVDFESLKTHVLEIGVKNEETLFVCGKKSPTENIPFDDKIKVTIEVINTNDAPEFIPPKSVVYRKEEEEPGKVLYKPKVTDDSDVKKIRFTILHDPDKWMTVDKITGELKATKKMDRESSFVENDEYKVLLGAVDTGVPPATGTGTVLIHLIDINDHKPRLAGNVTLCANKNNKVMVAANDSDKEPYSGPFTFSIAEDDGNHKQQWKLDPSTGEEGGLISLKSLPYGNYSLPLEIQDQQGSIGKETLKVQVCDCLENEVCRGRIAKKGSLGPAAIGIIFLALLAFLFLLLVFMCVCGRKAFKHIPFAQDESQQTFIKYNEEGGNSAIKDDTFVKGPPSNGATLTDGVKLGSAKKVQSPPPTNYQTSLYKKEYNSLQSTTSVYRQQSVNRQTSRESRKSYRGHSMELGASRQNSLQVNRNYEQGGSSWNNTLFNQRISEQLSRRLSTVDGHLEDYSTYKTRTFNDEGEGSKSHSLDQLSISDLGNDLTFIDDLGPGFKTLGNITQQHIEEKKIKL